MEAEAEKTAKILAAEAESEAILKVQQATADAIRLINDAAPGEGVLKIKALEAFQKAADGRATKIIIPSELQGLAGMCAAAKSGPRRGRSLCHSSRSKIRSILVIAPLVTSRVALWRLAPCRPADLGSSP